MKEREFMKILVTNDDGYTSEGIESIFNELKTYSADVHMLAPHDERSTSGHSLTLNAPLRVKKHGENKYHCTGFPADCVLLSLGHFHKNERPKVVVSGINKGANLAQDIYYSSTVAGAREAAFHGSQGVAVSLCCEFLVEEQEFHFKSASKAVKKLFDLNLLDSFGTDGIININVPNRPYQEIKGIKLTNLGFRYYSEEISHREDGRNRDYYWIVGKLQDYDKSIENSDCEAIEKGFISISYLPIHHHKNFDFEKLKNVLDEFNKGIK